MFQIMNKTLSTPIITAALSIGALAAHSFSSPELPEGWSYHHNTAIGTVDGVELRLDLVVPDTAPEKPLPMLVFIHGGGWNRGDKSAHARRIAGFPNRGYAGASITYRFTPEHPHPAQISDVQAAIRFIKAHAETFGIDPNRVILWGNSAGGHLASLTGTASNSIEFPRNGLWEAENHSVFAVISFAGPNSNFLSNESNNNRSMTAFLGAPSLSVPERALEAMPITHIDPTDPPFFIAHGDADTIVPVQSSRDFVAALKDAKVLVEYHELPGGGHNLSSTHPEAQLLAYSFIERLLAEQQSGEKQ